MKKSCETNTPNTPVTSTSSVMKKSFERSVSDQLANTPPTITSPVSSSSETPQPSTAKRSAMPKSGTSG